MRYFILLALTCGVSLTSDADICIPEPLVVHSVQGVVFYRKEWPMANVRVQLLKYKGDEKIVSETITDPEGRFYLKAEPGKYWLRARESHLGGLTVETKVKRGRSVTNLELIRFRLSFEPDRACGGSSVEVVKAAKSTANDWRPVTRDP